MVEDKSRLNNYSTDFLLDKQQQQIKIFPFCILTRMPISKERYGFSQTFIKENITILYLIHLLIDRRYIYSMDYFDFLLIFSW